MPIIFNTGKIGEPVPEKELLNPDGSTWGYRWKHRMSDDFYADVPSSDTIDYYINNYPIYSVDIKKKLLPKETIAPIKGFLPVLDYTGVIQYIRVNNVYKHIVLFSKAMNLFYETNFFRTFPGVKIESVSVFQTGICMLINSTSEKFAKRPSEIENWIKSMEVSNFKFKLLGCQTPEKFSISLTFTYNTIFKKTLITSRNYVAKLRDEKTIGKHFNYGAFKNANMDTFYCYPNSTKCSRISVSNKIPEKEMDTRFDFISKDYIPNDKNTGMIEVLISKKIPFEINHSHSLIPAFSEVIFDCNLLNEIRIGTDEDFQFRSKNPEVKNTGRHQYKMFVNIPVDYSLLPFDVAKIKSEVMNEFKSLVDLKGFYEIEVIYPIKEITSEVNFNENSISFILCVITAEKSK